MRSYSSNGRESATVLIMSVAVIVLIVSLATAYLKAVSPQRGAGFRQVMQRMAHLTAKSAEAHAIESILDDRNNRSFTSDQGRWRQDFYALASDLSIVQPWEYKGLNGAARDPAYDDDINVLPEQRIAYMLSLWALDNVSKYNDSAFHPILGAPDDRNLRNSVARWHNLDYLDKDLLSIFDSSPDEATALNNAQYIMRYAVEILDADSHININPDYPQFLNISGEPGYDASFPNYPTHYDSSDPDNLLYLKYQSYLQRFGRAMRSMHSTRDARATNIHQYTYGYDIHDTERVDIASDGSTRSNSKADYQIQSPRTLSEHFFRGDVSTWDIWANSHNNIQQTFIYAGRVHSNWTIVPVFKEGGTQAADYSASTCAQILSPYGKGLRDQHWDTNSTTSFLNGDRADNPNVPWNYNVLTMSIYARTHVLQSLSSHLLFEETINGGRHSPADLFGHNYPEAFPLSLEDGRHVKFIGGDSNNGIERIDFGFKFNSGTDANGTIFRASRNSYWWDSVGALAQAIDIAQKAFNRNWSTTDNTVAQGTIYDANSLLDITETNPANIVLQIEKEWLRIVGEDYDNPQSGLLASLEHGNSIPVGYGTPLNSKLEPGSNTRGMEYLLNDLRMSFFGGTALNFNADDANGDGTADADDAESTVNGWWYNGTHMWSWWWDGVQSTEVTGNEWMMEPTWYRFWYGDSQMATPYAAGARNRIARWDGSIWQEYIAGDNVFDELLAINSPFLNDPNGANWSASNKPIKPWSATGRFFVGHSQLFRLLCRGQIYDNITGQHAAEVNFDSTIAIPEVTGGSLEHIHTLYKRYHTNKNTE